MEDLPVSVPVPRSEEVPRSEVVPRSELDRRSVEHQPLVVPNTPLDIRLVWPLDVLPSLAEPSVPDSAVVPRPSVVPHLSVAVLPSVVPPDSEELRLVDLVELPLVVSLELPLELEPRLLLVPR